MLNRFRRGAGVTLVELIVALVIMGVALAGMVAVYTATTRASVDPVIVQQMQAIADNMMEEILMKPFSPPAGSTVTVASGRVNFDQVALYNDYGKNVTGIRDVEGNPIPGLERYTVLVKVEPVALGGITNPDPLRPNALRITVTVAISGNNPAYPPPIVLTGWRTNPS
ncbi:type IV pilus modification PilV family protein [Massilia putida]|uniref:type IV pilus modification PilV family protein n=1 Tax=Massilia putida TaxID=1141883 RepID=UPI000952BAD0|nr:prepilin-type N-terminal cleavage/methylation domain-containing protein [Massilia putida]